MTTTDTAPDTTTTTDNAPDTAAEPTRIEATTAAEPGEPVEPVAVVIELHPDAVAQHPDI